MSVSKSRGTKKKGPVFLQSQGIALTLEKDWAFQFLIKHFFGQSNRIAMEQLLSCPISFENPACQNLPYFPNYPLEKNGYGMVLVTLQPQFKFSSKLQKIANAVWNVGRHVP